MATKLQKSVLDIIVEKKRAGLPVVMRDIILEAGGSKSYAKNPHQLTQGSGFQKLLNQYPDEPILNAVYEDALSENDKRNATANRIIYLKLKDRFPANKLKVSQYEEELKGISVDE